MIKLLKTSYWIGIIADALATILLFSPKIANIVLQPQPFEISEVYLYVSRIAGALMLGWTVLLIWGVKKPIERAGILIITLFPVVTVLAIAAILFVKSNQIAFDKVLPMFILYVVLFATYIPSYLWAKKQNE
jgi:hypothetical protein